MDILALTPRPVAAQDPARPVPSAVPPGASDGKAPPGPSPSVTIQTEANPSGPKPPQNLLDLLENSPRSVFLNPGPSPKQVPDLSPEAREILAAIQLPPTEEQLQTALAALGFPVPHHVLSKSGVSEKAIQAIAETPAADGTRQGLAIALLRQVAGLPVPAASLIDMVRDNPPVPAPDTGLPSPSVPPQTGLKSDNVPMPQPMPQPMPVASAVFGTPEPTPDRPLQASGPRQGHGLTLDQDVVDGLNVVQVDAMDQDAAPVPTAHRPNVAPKPSPIPAPIIVDNPKPTPIPVVVPKPQAGDVTDDAIELLRPGQGPTFVQRQGHDIEDGTDYWTVKEIVNGRKSNDGTTFAPVAGQAGKTDSVKSSPHPVPQPQAVASTGAGKSAPTPMPGGRIDWQDIQPGAPQPSPIKPDPFAKKLDTPDIKPDSSVPDTAAGRAVQPAPRDVIGPVPHASLSDADDTATDTLNPVPHADVKATDDGSAVDLPTPVPHAEMRGTEPKPTPGPLPRETVASLHDQIADRIETMMAGRKSGTIKIRLAPDDLGTLTLTVRNFGSRVDTEIKASHEEVRLALQQHRQELVHNVENRGLSLNSFQIGQEAASQDQARQAAEERQDAIRQANLKANHVVSPSPSPIGAYRPKTTAVDTFA